MIPQNITKNSVAYLQQEQKDHKRGAHRDWWGSSWCLLLGSSPGTRWKSLPSEELWSPDIIYTFRLLSFIRDNKQRHNKEITFWRYLWINILSNGENIFWRTTKRIVKSFILFTWAVECCQWKNIFVFLYSEKFWTSSFWNNQTSGLCS